MSILTCMALTRSYFYDVYVEFILGFKMHVLTIRYFSSYVRKFSVKMPYPNLIIQTNFLRNFQPSPTNSVTKLPGYHNRLRAIFRARGAHALTRSSYSYRNLLTRHASLLSPLYLRNGYVLLVCYLF